MEQAPKMERVLDSTLISEVEVIQEGGIAPKTKEDLSRVVEPPLLEACEELYDKNIDTVMSSANNKDVIREEQEAYIDINFETLSKENKQIALDLGGETFFMHGARPVECVKLKFPLNESTTVGDVRRMAHETVSKLKVQEKVIQEYIDPFKFTQREIDKEIREIPVLKKMLEAWKAELQELEKTPESSPERLAELQRDLPDLDREIKRREELKR